MREVAAAKKRDDAIIRALSRRGVARYLEVAVTGLVSMNVPALQEEAEICEQESLHREPSGSKTVTPKTSASRSSVFRFGA